MSARSRELLGLIPVSLLVTAGFTAVLIARADEIQTVTVTYGAIFLGLCVFAHLFIRARLPDADPYLFPLAALLVAFGLVMIYRIDEELARQQAAVVRVRADPVRRDDRLPARPPRPGALPLRDRGDRDRAAAAPARARDSASR